METNAELLALAKNRADVCRVFGSARRVLILWMLDEREMSVSEIAAAIDASLQNTSQHLRLMRDKGILESRREGTTVFYRVSTDNPLLAECPLLSQAPHEQHQSD